ncbi:MAG: YjbH domain-containing protein, partial [Pseudomonadales bacterium]|nr:YjbH domain-containing protein [Pseudomonadales bacterium]
GYQIETDAVQRLLRLAEFYVPKEYGEIVLTASESGAYTHATHYRRRDANGFAEARFGDPIAPVDPPFETAYQYPNLILSANLGVRPYIFDPDDPLRLGVFARFSADLQLEDEWLLRGSWIQNIYNDFDGITRESNSVLPRVRSDLAEYLKQGETGIDYLFAEKRGTVRDGVFYHAFAGYLEEMYAGAGAEVLWRPFGSRFAVGANAIAVRQRDFDRGFGFRDYDTVIGHLSAYWASPIYEMDVIVHAGRYLARDWGTTIEVQRTFPNGWSVGAFATFTDVSAREFGEGSFDKGITLRIPVASFLELNTGSRFDTRIRPIQRDGGQRLGFGSTLWEMHRSTHVDDLTATRARLWP